MTWSDPTHFQEDMDMVDQLCLGDGDGLGYCHGLIPAAAKPHTTSGMMVKIHWDGEENQKGK